MIALPKFQGLAKHRTAAERELFARTIAGAGFDPVAVGAIIEMESAHSWDPAVGGAKGAFGGNGYAVGLIQFAPGTAKSLGTSTAELERMTFAEQLPFVVKYYQMWGGHSAFSRPGDYYLAGWGASPNTPDDFVLSRQGSKAYEWNSVLDTNGDGTITARELRSLVNGSIAYARTFGEWLIDERVPIPDTVTRRSALPFVAVAVGLVTVAVMTRQGRKKGKS
jgi:hypothetical protein